MLVSEVVDRQLQFWLSDRRRQLTSHMHVSVETDNATLWFKDLPLRFSESVSIDRDLTEGAREKNNVDLIYSECKVRMFIDMRGPENKIELSLAPPRGSVCSHQHTCKLRNFVSPNYEIRRIKQQFKQQWIS